MTDEFLSPAMRRRRLDSLLIDDEFEQAVHNLVSRPRRTWQDGDSSIAEIRESMKTEQPRVLTIGGTCGWCIVRSINERGPGAPNFDVEPVAAPRPR